MTNDNILNIESMMYCDNAYQIIIGHHLSIYCIVFADDEQEALDVVIDHYEEIGDSVKGYFLDQNTIDNMTDKELDEYISGGNNYSYLSFTHDELRISKCPVSDLKLLANVDNFK